MQLAQIKRIAAVFCLSVCVNVAQAPAPAYGPPVPVDQAKAAAESALAEARQNHWRMAVAVVDPTGELIYYEKMDDTQTGSADVAIGKARTAARFKRASKVFQDRVAAGGTGLSVLAMPGVVPVEGGVPLMVDGKIVGAIGVSGDSSDHDGQCAQAGADSLARSHTP